MYYSTKTYTHSAGLSCAFRQWRANSHCKYLHGYALSVKLIFMAEELDENNWVVDFGGLKGIKTWLEDLLDHKTLVAADDPQLPLFRMLHTQNIIRMQIVPSTGCEATARFIFAYTEQWLKNVSYSPRCLLFSVEVREHEGNSAVYVNPLAGAMERPADRPPGDD